MSDRIIVDPDVSDDIEITISSEEIIVGVEQITEMEVSVEVVDQIIDINLTATEVNIACEFVGSFSDKVKVVNSLTDLPVTAPQDEIYVVKQTNRIYRYNGSEYISLSNSLELGETSTTAYRGDRGKTAYDHTQVTSGNPHNVSKSEVGLGNVDNTSDILKPISNATQSALNGKVDTSSKGVAGGVASLDSSGKVPTGQLPSFVDDVLECYTVSGATPLSAGWLSLTDGGTPLTPERSKIYVLLSPGQYYNHTYRWGGSTYVEIGSPGGSVWGSIAGNIQSQTDLINLLPTVTWRGY